MTVLYCTVLLFSLAAMYNVSREKPQNICNYDRWPIIFYSSLSIQNIKTFIILRKKSNNIPIERHIQQYSILYWTILYCTVLHWTMLYCTVLNYAVLYCTVLYWIMLYCTVLFCIELRCTVLYCTVPVWARVCAAVPSSAYFSRDDRSLVAHQSVRAAQPESINQSINPSIK